MRGLLYKGIVRTYGPKFVRHLQEDLWEKNEIKNCLIVFTGIWQSTHVYTNYVMKLRYRLKR